MAGDEPEVGDKVSWNWGGGAPGGTVGDKKTEGEIAITSKRGNKIKKNADKSDPAVHVERSGNDVVKKASELNVEQKNAKGKGGKQDAQKDDKKRKHDDEEKSEEKDKTKGADPHVKNSEGKEVKPGGKEANKKQREGEGEGKGQRQGGCIEARGKDRRQRKGSRGREEASRPAQEERVPVQEGEEINSSTRGRPRLVAYSFSRQVGTLFCSCPGVGKWDS